MTPVQTGHCAGILTVIQIAMKYYLLIPLLFLAFFSLAVSSFSQEPTPHSLAQALEHSPLFISTNDEHLDHEDLKTDSPEGEPIPNTWPNHLEKESDSFQAKFFHMLMILGLLIGFMLLASWALKRMMRTKMTQLNTGSTIKILETRYLSPRATLYLIEAQDQTFLIGESPTQVTYLATLSQDQRSIPK